MAANHFGAVLAGGKSRRFGSTKALAELGGQSILDRVIGAHLAAGLTVFVVADREDRFPECKVPVIGDEVAGSGPIGGLHAALRHAHERGGAGVCVTGCDTPFVEKGVLEALVEASRGNDAVVIFDERRDSAQPLIGWYSTRLFGGVESAIADHDLAMNRFLSRIPKLRFLHTSELRLARPVDTVFLNVNRPADLDVAREYLELHPDS